MQRINTFYLLDVLSSMAIDVLIALGHALAGPSCIQLVSIGRPRGRYSLTWFIRGCGQGMVFGPGCTILCIGPKRKVCILSPDLNGDVK